MSVTVAIRFPLGRYHATPWERSVNEGAVEWPPSPWRLLRTLVSTWYTRSPELPVSVLDPLLAALAEPAAYRTPAVAAAGHTRHYLPDVAHQTGQTGNTDLTLDPYLWVSKTDDLLVRWEVALAGEQRETLAKLLELVPYLGRAESVCDARLLADGGAPEPDQTWWRPDGGGTQQVRLLAPVPPVRRPLLELGTVQMRKLRRTMPPETRWVTYARTPPPESAESAEPAERPAADAPPVVAVRFTVASRAPLRSANGILLADQVHRIVTGTLDGGRPELMGYDGAATDHRHAHWVPLATDAHDRARVESLLVWVPAGLTPTEVGRILTQGRLRGISGWRGGYEVKGLPRVDLLFQAAGTVAQVAPELCGPARRWRSLTPYLPVRHHKPRKETLAEYLTGDVHWELGYRHWQRRPRVEADDRLPAGWVLPFRRYRFDERRERSRPGYGLRLEFDQPVAGPLLLGQLSHFGYGIFVPNEVVPNEVVPNEVGPGGAA